MTGLRVDGAQLRDAAGNPVLLRGVNLGNWFLIEPWMLGLEQGERPGAWPDQASVLRCWRERFGEERAARLLETFRASWIRPRDLAIVRSFGFNTVRVPFHYSLLEDDAAPKTLRPDAFRWLEHAVGMARDAGLYAILDLHGVAGGQSLDAPCGEVGQNRLWRDAECRERTVWLWGKLAARFADDPTVVAYDVLNEPFSDMKEDVRETMLALFEDIYAAIRASDPHTLIYAPGTLQGFAFYGQPAERGWTAVGFTEHTYVGLFGWGEPSLASHARVFAQWVEGRARMLGELQVPFMVGEFNVVYDRAARAPLMRACYDAYTRLGWGTAMWSYKLVKPKAGLDANNWYVVTNGAPCDLTDLREVDFDTLEARLASLATMPLSIDERLHRCLTAAAPPALPLPRVKAVFEAPDASVEGWTASDIGDAPPGGLEVEGETWTVWGGGRDIWGRADAFRFVHRALPEGGTLWTRIDAIEPTDRFAKAGLMVRDGLEPDAPFVMVHTVPDGRVLFTDRKERGGSAREEVLSVPGLPCAIGIARIGIGWCLHFNDGNGRWRFAERVAPDYEDPRIGVAVLAHDESVLCPVRMAAPRFAEVPPELPPRVRGRNLLKNPSFDTLVASAPDRPEHWQRWGPWLRRDIAEEAGCAVLSYRHEMVEGYGSSGAWQDVDVEPGLPYRFELDAQLVRGAHGSVPAELELRLEVPGDAGGPMYTLASRTYYPADFATRGRAARLPAGERPRFPAVRWSRLHIACEAVAPLLRVLVIVTPSEHGPRTGMLRLTGCVLRAR